MPSHLRISLFSLAALALSACGGDSPQQRNTAGASASPAATASPTAGASPTATPQAGPSASPTASPATSPVPSATASPGASPDPGGEQNPRDFGEANNNQIRPGVQVVSDTGSCTSNFIYHDETGALYIGAAAHCFSPDTNSGVDPCEADNLPLGAAVSIENASMPGELAYSSWQAMKLRKETPGSDICRGNDFALVRIHPDDFDNVHPAAMVFGGPEVLHEGAAAAGDRVYSYGQSPFHAGVATLERKQGTISGQTSAGWTYTVRTDNPGLSGDSGSAVLHESGSALGVLVTVGVSLGGAVSNGVCNLPKALDYAVASLNRPLWLTRSPGFSP